MTRRNPSEEGRIRYLLLESMQRKSVIRWLYEACDNPRWEYVFAGTEWQDYLSESPILLESRQDSDTYKEVLSELKKESLSGLIIESDQALGQVLHWVQERLTVYFDGERRGLLRFYDPVIWHRLAPFPNESSDVVNRIIYWHKLEGQHRWLISDHPEPFNMRPKPFLSEQQRAAIA